VTITVRWAEWGNLLRDAGDVGGDAQAGTSYGRRFVNAADPHMPAFIDVYGYAAWPDPNNQNPAALGYGVQIQIELLRSATLSDPASSELWADVRYPASAGFGLLAASRYSQLALASREALRQVRLFTPPAALWDGRAPFEREEGAAS
jgi:hypothetical protein